MVRHHLRKFQRTSTRGVSLGPLVVYFYEVLSGGEKIS